MGTSKKYFVPIFMNKEKRFYPIYCAQKGTSNDIVFSSSRMKLKHIMVF
jgi:hypothetical protein